MIEKLLSILHIDNFADLKDAIKHTSDDELERINNIVIERMGQFTALTTEEEEVFRVVSTELMSRVEIN